MSDEQSVLAAIIIIDELLYEDEEDEIQVKKKKRVLQREEFSNQKLLKDLKENDPKDYPHYLRIGSELFNKLLDMIKHKITKEDTVMREAISSEIRLAITLLYLVTGISFADLKFSTAVSPQSIGIIVLETCDAINEELKKYIKLPKTSSEWLVEAEKFYQKSKFPHCLGALCGKHIKIKKPPHSGSNYFNYKKTFSIVLMAIVNCDSEFLMVDVGTNGRISDSAVFKNTKFFIDLENKELNLPVPRSVFSETRIPYVFVSEESFDLDTNIMTPYANSELSSSQILFNKKLSSAMVKGENTFKILAARFRVLNTTIALVPEKASKVVLTCCYLHNFIRKEICQPGRCTPVLDVAESTYLFSLEPTLVKNSSKEGNLVRNNLCKAIYSLENKG